MSPATVHIAGYQLTDVIYKGIHTILYRGHRQADQQPIVLKVLKADAPSLEAITHIKQKFQIRQGLDIAGIVRCYSLKTHFNGLLLVLEDFGGTSLKQLLASKSLNLSSFLNIAPHQINPDIPLTVSSLVMKLLAKNAEERYQSAEGLKADLEKCLTQWQTRGAIANFTPGQLESSGQLYILQKLYGRQQEVAQLQEAFERIAAGERKRGGEDICQSPLPSPQSKIPK